ncbi:MAG: pilus assembly PilX N-terminal domain-containing protein [Deltaproteobacteria bacterium]|nr:pilus assembly PilX N-terminal domain-containing protein [Deltaproteobacteria bacterium]
MSIPVKRKFTMQSDAGFALVTAIIACMILAALGILVISMSTRDLKTSSDVVGNKKAMYATESGIHKLTQSFNPAEPSYNIGSSWADVDATNDPGSQYKYSSSVVSDLAPIPLAGYSIEAGQGWGMSRYEVNIEGRNTTYRSEMEVDVGLGFGPIPISTIYR